MITKRSNGTNIGSNDSFWEFHWLLVDTIDGVSVIGIWKIEEFISSKYYKMFLSITKCRGFIYKTKYTNDPFWDFKKTIGKVFVVGWLLNRMRIHLLQIIFYQNVRNFHFYLCFRNCDISIRTYRWKFSFDTQTPFDFEIIHLQDSFLLEFTIWFCIVFKQLIAQQRYQIG